MARLRDQDGIVLIVDDQDDTLLALEQGSLAVADYVIAPRGSGFAAYPLKDYRPVFRHESDAAAVVQSAMNELGTAGGTILATGNLTWGSVPAISPGITGKFHFRGNGSCKITLSSSGPRLFDFGKVADHDTFQNIEISDLLVDVNFVGGRHHIILGTYVNGSSNGTVRINVKDVTIRRVNWINAPVDPTTTNHRLGVWIVVNQPGANEATQNVIQRVLVEDSQGLGGNGGFTIGGTGGTGGAPDLNIVYDEIVFRRCRHSMLAVQSGSFSSANFQLGSRAKGGPIGSRIENCYGEFSGDVGIETDNGSVALVDNTVRDAFNANYLCTNFNTPSTQQATQLVAYQRCRSIVISLAAACKGFSLRSATQATMVPLGQIIVENCSSYLANGTVGTTGWALYRDDGGTPPGTFATKLTIKDFTYEHVVGGTTTATVRAVHILPSAGAANYVEIDGIHAIVSGSYSTGTLTYNLVDLAGSNMRYIVRRVRADVSTTGVQTNTFRLVNLGEIASSSFSGRQVIRECGYGSISGGGTSPFGILVRSTGSLTVNGKIILEANDFSAMAGGTDFSLDATQTALGKIHTRANTWRVPPAPTTLTGLVTATGKVLSVPWDAIISCTPGSGAAITAVDLSTNGGTNYTNLLTQASGAMPASPTLIEAGPVPPDSLVKATFTTTQPTINLTPVNP